MKTVRPKGSQALIEDWLFEKARMQKVVPVPVNDEQWYCEEAHSSRAATIFHKWLAFERGEQPFSWYFVIDPKDQVLMNKQHMAFLKMIGAEPELQFPLHHGSSELVLSTGRAALVRTIQLFVPIGQQDPIAELQSFTEGVGLQYTGVSPTELSELVLS